jgi:hypothetical protein
MEHAKKMVLLPKESVDRLQSLSVHGKLNSVQTPGTTTSRLDAEMNEILNSSDTVNEREKWQQYSRVLQRYLHFKDSDSKRKKEENEEEEEEGGVGETAAPIDTHIVESVPSKFRSKASQLLRHLRNFSGVTWDADGKTFLDGVIIRKANIIDLVNDAMRERKKVRPPAGYPQFAAALRQACVPREFVGNPRVLQYMNSSFSTSSPKLNKSDSFEKSLNKTASGASEYEDPVGDSSRKNIENISLTETPVLKIKKRKRGESIDPALTKWSRLRKV